MFVKKDADSAFKFGRFEDGKEYESEIPVLVAKRPAMKRPAAAANAEIDSEPATEILPKSEDKKAPTPQLGRRPEVRGFTAGKYSVMFYRSGKGSFGIRPKGESTLMTINSLGSPARAASLIKDVGLPRLEAGEDPLKVKEDLYELLPGPGLALKGNHLLSKSGKTADPQIDALLPERCSCSAVGPC